LRAASVPIHVFIEVLLGEADAVFTEPHTSDIAPTYLVLQLPFSYSQVVSGLLRLQKRTTYTLL
jgi:hypothetical protein